jgi:uncharacterized membrane protein
VVSSLVNNFLKGCVVIVPAIGTAWCLWLLVTSVDTAVSWVVPLPVPGIGLLIVVGITTIVGAVASNVVAQRVFALFEAGLDRIPLVRLLYNALRDLLTALAGEKRSFERPAVIEVGDGVRVLGFVTTETFEDPALAGSIGVYLPQSYNFAGQFLVVDRSRVTPLARPGAEHLAFVVSGGVARQGGSKPQNASRKLM